MNNETAQSPVASGAATFSCDVLVLGGGPAGASIATLLARRGRQVTVLEKAHHPRFHIGESLLPANVALFEELGVSEEVRKIGMPKWGAEFVSAEHNLSTLIEFGDALDKSMPMSWQVRRSELDEILFRNAAKAGARMLEGHRARSVEFDAEGATVDVELDDGSRQIWRCKYLVDATGRDTLLANKFKSKKKHPRHNSSALYGHFVNARRLEGKNEGNISILWFKHGWFWFIPLADGTTSVGAVAWPYYMKSRDKPVLEFFMESIAMCPELSDRLKDATLVDDQVYATGNYSYAGTHCVGDRYAMLGDAYAFIDPVFSSGVHLAMTSAFAAVPLVETTLDRGVAAAAGARKKFARDSLYGPKVFSWFIYRVTNPIMREFFLFPGNPLRVKEALITVLAGDIFGRTRFRLPLNIFKGFYYGACLSQPARAWKAWRMRKHNIRDVEAAA